MSPISEQFHRPPPQGRNQIVTDEYIIFSVNRLLCSLAHKTHVLQSLGPVVLKPTTHFTTSRRHSILCNGNAGPSSTTIIWPVLGNCVISISQFKAGMF